MKAAYCTRCDAETVSDGHQEVVLCYDCGMAEIQWWEDHNG
jgi:predicted RNA-binding Zn-ribbon protein involved in translation (DUF1610 family)